MNFNLNTLALKDTTEYQLKHPVTDAPLFADADETLPVTVELYGTSSKQYRNAIAAMRARDLKRKGKTPTFEEMRDEGVKLLVACSIKINNLELNNAPVDNEDAFQALYSDAQFSWLKKQVDDVLTSTDAFLPQ